MKILFGLFLLLIYIIFGPILVIWSLNNLFILNIEYTFNNWLSCYILMSILSIIFHNHGVSVKIQDDKYYNETSRKKTTD
jgi:hypothetical protein